MFSKYKGKSIAEVSDIINRKYKDRHTNSISMNSYEAEMKHLIALNEKLKPKSEVSSQEVPKMEMGGDPLKELIKRLNPIKTFDSNFTLPEYSVESYLKDQKHDNKIGLSLEGIDNAVKGIGLGVETSSFRTSKYDEDKKSKSFKDTAVGRMLGNSKAPLLLGKAAELGISAGLLAGGAEQANVTVGNNFGNVLDKLDTRINIDPLKKRVVQQVRATQENNKRYGDKVRRNLDIVSNAQAINAMSDIEFKKQSSDIQTNQLLAQQMSSQSAMYDNAAEMSRQQTSANTSRYQDMIQQFGTNFADIGNFLYKDKVNQDQQGMMLKVLNEKYADVGFNMDAMENYLKGLGYTGESLVEVKKLLNKK